MKKFSMLGSGLAVVLGVALLSVTVTAQETKTNRDRSQAGKLDSKTSGANVRASKLIGMNIQNEQGKSVGAVSDIVLDIDSGNVSYMAVTYGGFLGLGNKMFAVPFEAFACRQDANDPDETILVLNVTQQQLDGAIGFDEDSWPNFADTKFTSELDKRYGVDRTIRNRIRDRDVDVRVGPDGVKVDVEPKPKTNK